MREYRVRRGLGNPNRTQLHEYILLYDSARPHPLKALSVYCDAHSTSGRVNPGVEYLNYTIILIGGT